MNKQRPVVVVSSDAIGRLPLRLVAPITKWKDRFHDTLWHVKIEPDATNGLETDSAVDTLQLRGLDTQRFIRKMGKVSSSKMEEIAAAIASVVEYQ